MDRSSPLIRNLDLDGILGESVHLFRSNFTLVAAIVLLTSLPIYAWQALALAEPGEWVAPLHYRAAADLDAVAGLIRWLAKEGWDGKLVASLMVVGYAAVLQSGALAFALNERCMGRPVTALQAILQAMSRLGALAVGNGIVAAVVVVVALVTDRLPQELLKFAAFAAVMLVLFPHWLFVSQSVMVEGLGGIAGLKRSFALVRGRFWFVLSVWLVLELVLVVVSIIPTFLLGVISVTTVPMQIRQLAYLLIPAVATILIDPFWDITVLLLFLQLRRRKERAVKPSL